ncbi:hypothetical protein SAMN05920897_11856 [Alkalispirochaeta americana]|uniref:PorV/PorQ family protein n=1 Tax=Alkalispirochaeta americana TaxID=159291 RepID=A0A1N6WRQ9_9SPIO|nr:hypothetical protein [Alkalispirochaeta americana]SIQ92725.1 hypothetical protein SAMN05920897_11856 [Alkalispirochaeta americana]
MSDRARAVRAVLVLVFLGGFLGGLAPGYASTVKQPEFRPLSPRIMGQGGSFTAIAQGYDSLFTNPAGVARSEGPRLTIPSMTLWVHSRPGKILPTIGAMGADESLDSDDDDDPIIKNLKEQFTTNGFGLGAALGIGYIGSRVGLGLNIAMDSYLYGETFPLGLQGEIQQQLMLAVAYAYPLEIGPVSLSLGAALRPTLRIVSLVDSDTAAELISRYFDVEVEGADDDEDLMDSITALNGWGVSFDAGLLATYGSVTLGVQARNLFNTQMDYSRNSLREIADSLMEGGLPEKSSDQDDPSYVKENYVIPMEFSFGIAWRPDLGDTRLIINPVIHAQVTDPFKMTDQDSDKARSMWTRLHFGTEVEMLNFLALRFGVNQGYATAGFGMDLSLLSVNFAIFAREFGRYPGDQQVSGAALEFAFRL